MSHETFRRTGPSQCVNVEPFVQLAMTYHIANNCPGYSLNPIYEYIYMQTPNLG